MRTAKTRFLTDGEFLVTSTPMEIHTILGSCVSVCLWDKELKIAGMNHYLMPGSENREAGNPKYGYSSIRMLIQAIINRGSSLTNIEAKVFGGAHSLKALQSPVFSVGVKNIEIATLMLQKTGIKITAQHTGGNFGRKIIFNTQTGKVKMQLLNKRVEEVNEEINKGTSY